MFVMMKTLGHYYLPDECDWNNDCIENVLQGGRSNAEINISNNLFQTRV